MAPYSGDLNPICIGNEAGTEQLAGILAAGRRGAFAEERRPGESCHGDFVLAVVRLPVPLAALLAGFGVGGLAVALAAQKTVENLFGGVTLYADQPVKVGDFCRFGDKIGTVEEIGLRSTRVRTLDRTLVTVPNAEFSTLQLERARGKLSFNDVVLCYRRSDQRVLDEISFEVEPNQTVAIDGRSGSGKSSLVNLIPRLYEYDSGEVLLDGERLDNYRIRDLRRQIAYVGQDVRLFNDTIRNNIVYGIADRVDEAQIVAAAKRAHAREFIVEMPEQLDTEVGERGVLLSGGQRQRIAIARALLKNAPILILDEATSALDTESERYIQEAMEQLMQNRTTLVIAHRLSTIEHADHILVVLRGAGFRADLGGKRHHRPRRRRHRAAGRGDLHARRLARFARLSPLERKTVSPRGDLDAAGAVNLQPGQLG